MGGREIPSARLFLTKRIEKSAKFWKNELVSPICVRYNRNRYDKNTMETRRE